MPVLASGDNDTIIETDAAMQPCLGRSEALMTRTLVDIDDDALAAAAAELGTSTKAATVNRALAEIAARPLRLAALERLRTAEE